ncbi:dihydrofolate reductase family protein [Chryseobacterium sp. MFBS3-17]|uniref:dihydrofolate reductase family protein n=1 Tax=Chryseobacterium sp. MFBS3-17 TaxID=2886689 RepID=UPI001D0ECC4F|nr:dihydrofolate reductase family protein [Chryseobacterium sp. MFBS3-17]MCC2591745.1 dihydrofolate reductase family protein [Chryseobacterium sp. MFBS3-17]
MRKITAALNMTLDGIFDHDAVTADAELHRHYTRLLTDADTILYGRITYQLMEYWKTLAAKPSGEQSMDDFAAVMDRIQKIVFSTTLHNTDWNTARLATLTPEEEVKKLKKIPGGDILVGSRSLIIQLLERDLIDEFQLCIHPVIAGKGQNLFEHFNMRKTFQLHRTKTFQNGALVCFYHRSEEDISV